MCCDFLCCVPIWSCSVEWRTLPFNSCCEIFPDLCEKILEGACAFVTADCCAPLVE